MVERTIPTLSEKGWLHNEDVRERLDEAMSNAFASDYSQSGSFRGEITSIQHIISSYDENVNKLQGDLQTAMDNYLGKQFDKVDIEVKVTENDDGSLDIVTSGLITNNGETLDLQYGLRSRNSNIEKLANILNGESL